MTPASEPGHREMGMTSGRRKRAGRTCEVVNARAWFTLVRARRATVIATLRNAIGAAIVEKDT
jgi:hypothetical protein